MFSTVKKDILKYCGVYIVLLVFAYIAQLIYFSNIDSFSSQWVYSTWSNTYSYDMCISLCLFYC